MTADGETGEADAAGEGPESGLSLSSKQRAVRPDALLRSAGRVIFGDRLGYTIFLATICVAMLAWRTEVFITDNETLVATLEALGNGQFYIEQVEGDSWFNAPGTEVREGYVYGRNYGQLIVSLPALFALQAVDAVANIRVALIAFWHLAALACLTQVGKLLDRRFLFGVGGGVVVLLSFVLNLTLATAIPTIRLELLALQLTAIVAAGLVGVVMYRLVAFQHDRRLGAFVGLATVIVLPIGFWATIPKRHVFSSLVVVLVLYFFARSREADATTTLPWVGAVPHHRAGAYAAVGYLTWIHSAEALFVFLPLLVIDLLTAPANDRRTLAFVGGVFAISLVPTLVTNWIVAGHPLEPPRLMSGGPVDPAIEPGTGEEQAETGGIREWIYGLPAIGSLLAIFSTVSGVVSDSLATLQYPDRMWHVFARSAGGDITGGGEFAGNPIFQGTNLSILESAPILAGVLATAGIWLRSLVSRQRNWRSYFDPTAVLAAVLIGAFLLLYLSRLPLYVQVTQRYVLPIFPLALYLLVSSATVRELVSRVPATMSWAYAIAVLVGGQVYLTIIVTTNYSIGEAARLHGDLSLVFAGFVLGALAVFAGTKKFERIAGVALGLAAAAGTIFLVLATFYLFPSVAEYVLPAVEWLARRL